MNQFRDNERLFFNPNVIRLHVKKYLKKLEGERLETSEKLKGYDPKFYHGDTQGYIKNKLLKDNTNLKHTAEELDKFGQLDKLINKEIIKDDEKRNAIKNNIATLNRAQDEHNERMRQRINRNAIVPEASPAPVPVNSSSCMGNNCVILKKGGIVRPKIMKRKKF
jgi:L-fucose mutarotase/ribose pyranase (RbsD/FucU family)